VESGAQHQGLRGWKHIYKNILPTYISLKQLYN